jgi:hypothetical protein
MNEIKYQGQIPVADPQPEVVEEQPEVVEGQPVDAPIKPAA